MDGKFMILITNLSVRESDTKSKQYRTIHMSKIYYRKSVIINIWTIKMEIFATRNIFSHFNQIITIDILKY